MSKHRDTQDGRGYEYQPNGHCQRTGRPFVTPIAWNSTTKDRPIYATCTCCMTGRQ